MSVREFPSEDSQTRQERAEQCRVLDIRQIGGKQFGVSHTVFEVDVQNENGEIRENITIIPRILFESTKDVQHRHDKGIVGKYTRALARESEKAHTELSAGLKDQRDSVQERIRELKEKDSRLLHTQHDLE